MKNHKVSMKLAIGFVTSIIFSLIIGAIGILGIVKIKDENKEMYDSNVKGVAYSGELSLNMQKMRVIYRDGLLGLMLGNPEQTESAIANLLEIRPQLRILLAKYEATIRDQRDREAYEGIMTELDSYDVVVDDILAALQSGDTEETIDVIYHRGGIKVVSQINDLAAEMYNSNLENADAVEANNLKISQLLLTALIVVIIVSIAAAIFLSYYITGLIVKPIIKLSKSADQIAIGNLDANFNLDSTDEIGRLGESFQKVATTVKNLITSMNNVSNEIMAGDIDSRIDDEQFSGSFNTVAKCYNETVQQVFNDTLIILNCVKDISEGDFSTEMPKMPGKKERFNQAVDTLKSNLLQFSDEVSTMVQKARAGNLHQKANSNKYKANWRDLIVKVEDLLTVVSEPISEASTCLEEMSKGNISIRIVGDYKGEFNLIKTSFNKTLEVIGSYINEISEVLNDMANDNLNQRIDREYMGDFNMIKISLNTILDRFNDVFNNIQSASEQVASGSRMIADTSMTLADGATQQATSVQHLNASIDEINMQTEKNAKESQEANTLSFKSKENAEKGNSEMEKMLKSMEGIKTASDSIFNIIKVIEDIAFQTNLLALNAAVEAARAGEHGKGFAVVAEEVRTLAARSQNAAKETTILIQDSINRVDEGAKTASETAESLETIVNDFSQLSAIITNIAKSSAEQAVAISEIMVNINQISGVIQSNSSTSQETAATSEELSAQSDNLKSMIEVFRLRSENNFMGNEIMYE